MTKTSAHLLRPAGAALFSHRQQRYAADFDRAFWFGRAILPDNWCPFGHD
jgi:hypothetical protein